MIPPRDRRRSSTTSACLQRHQPGVSATPAIVGTADADILVALGDGHGPTDRLRPRAAAQAARAVSRHHVLLPAGRHRQPDPELRPAGANRHPDRRAVDAEQPASSRRSCSSDMQAGSPASSTCGSQQPFNQPQLHVVVDRTAPRQQVGFTQRDVASNLLISLSRQRARPRRPSGSTRRTACSYRSPRRRRSIRSTRCRRCSNIPCRPDRRPRRSCSATSGHDRARHAVERRVALQRAAGHRHLGAVQDRDLGSVAATSSRIVDVQPQTCRAATR